MICRAMVASGAREPKRPSRSHPSSSPWQYNLTGSPLLARLLPRISRIPRIKKTLLPHSIPPGLSVPFVPLSEKTAHFRQDSRSLTSLLPFFNAKSQSRKVAKELFSVFASPRLCVFALKGLSLSVQSAKSVVQFLLVAAGRAVPSAVQFTLVPALPRCLLLRQLLNGQEIDFAQKNSENRARRISVSSATCLNEPGFWNPAFMILPRMILPAAAPPAVYYFSR